MRNTNHITFKILMPHQNEVNENNKEFYFLEIWLSILLLGDQPNPEYWKYKKRTVWSHRI